MSHEFLKSFKSAWGVPVERKPKTPEGVLELAEAALEDKSLESPLARAADKLIDKVSSELDSAILEFENSHEEDAQVVEDLRGTAEAYQLILDGLEELADPEGVLRDGTDWLDEGLKKRRHHQDNVMAWKHRPACPLCSKRSRTERTCKSCGVHLVIPDLEPPKMPSVVLGPAYIALREVAGDVATGKRKFVTFDQAAQDLVSELSKLQILVKQIPAEVYDTSDIIVEAENVALGLDRMQRFENTCAIADLNQGWVQVSKAGVKLRSLTEALTRMLG